MKKKIIAFLITVVMVLSLATTALAAAVTPEFSTTAVEAGDTVTVTLKLDEALEDVASLEYYLYFNSDLFTLTSSENGNAHSKMQISNLLTKGGAHYSINYVDTTSEGQTIAAGTLYTLVFTAKADLTAQQAADFELKCVDVCNSSWGNIDAPVQNGKLTVTINPKAADPEYTVSMPQDRAVVAGESVDVPVTVGSTDEKLSAYNAFDMQFTYDSTKLELLTTEIDGLTVTTGTGTVRVQGYGASKTFAAPAFTLRFKATDAGEASIKLTGAKVDGSNHAIGADAPAAKVLDDEMIVNVTGYAVTLPADFTGEATVAPGADYTFTAKDKNYDYTFSGSTMGSADATVVDNGDGTFTVKNVRGNLVIKDEKTGKKFNVTLGTDMTGAAQAQYMANYTATLNADAKYTYDVSVTIGGKSYAGYSVSEGVYTIPGADITGDVVFNVVKTLIPPTMFQVTFQGSGAGDVAENTPKTVEEGTDYAFQITQAAGYTYTVTATMNGTDAEVKAGEAAGAYTIENVTGDLVINVEKESDLTVEVNSYVELDGKTVFLVTAKGTLPEGSIYSYDGTAMFYSEAYEAYSFLTIVEKGTAFTAADAKKLVTVTQATAESITGNPDVNDSQLVDVNDAQLTYDIYNGAYDNFETVTMAKFLRADVNGSKNVNVEDARAIIAVIQ